VLPECVPLFLILRMSYTPECSNIYYDFVLKYFYLKDVQFFLSLLTGVYKMLGK